MITMTISELAQAAGVHIETVRYYERRGLLPVPARRPSGYRAYPATIVTRLRFIKNAQELGFSLAEIEKLLALRVDTATSCAEVRRQAEVKLAEVEQKLHNPQGSCCLGNVGAAVKRVRQELDAVTVLSIE